MRGAFGGNRGQVMPVLVLRVVAQVVDCLAAVDLVAAPAVDCLALIRVLNKPVLPNVWQRVGVMPPVSKQ